MDITFSSNSLWTPLESELQDDGHSAVSNFILRSALVPAKSQQWEALDVSNKAVFTPGSLEPGGRLCARQPSGKCAVALSPQQEAICGQSWNKSSRFPQQMSKSD